jgi:amidase
MHSTSRAADVRRKSGKPLGAMDGIPVTLKDNIETAGPMHTTAGAELLLDHVASRDAPLVAQLRAAGAVILGKANLSEWASVVALTPPYLGGSSAVDEQTLNPHDAALTGGSSARSAAGTAARLTMVSVGTEDLRLADHAVVVERRGGHETQPRPGQRGRRHPADQGQRLAGPIGRSVTDVAVLLGPCPRPR